MKMVRIPILSLFGFDDTRTILIQRSSNPTFAQTPREDAHPGIRNQALFITEEDKRIY